MSLENLANLVKIGLLNSEPPDQAEFDGLLRSARSRLNDAQRTANALESRFTLAYDAGHSLALAALRWHGYRPDKKRYVVFQTLAATLAIAENNCRLLDHCHSKRNTGEYEGHYEVDERLVGELISVTEEVLRRVERLGPVPPRANG
ncbi:MAG: hypothetical protein EXR27_07960 [Betaproteobacteria bacterium]|nr:hypothetical protein [Betaproteobacteria bacterium]